jgi:hypothetical protein
MIRAFPSGSYSSGVWADSHNSFQPSPPYSPEPASSEFTFQTLSLPDSVPSWNGDPLWSSTASFLYESPLVNVSLGRRVWDLRLPVYGFNGLVQGAVKLSRKCDHVVRVEVSVEKALIFSQRWAQLIDVFCFVAPGQSQSDYLRERTALRSRQSQRSHV